MLIINQNLLCFYPMLVESCAKRTNTYNKAAVGTIIAIYKNSTSQEHSLFQKIFQSVK